MSYYLRNIFIALVLAIAVPSSLGGDWNIMTKPEVEKYLSDLCSQTNNTDYCLNLVESEVNGSNNTTILSVALFALDSAKETVDKVHEDLERSYNETKDANLKNKYLQCSYNYNDAIRNFELVKKTFSNGDCEHILHRIDDTVEDVNRCSREFSDYSFEEGYLNWMTNNEFRTRLEFLRAATINWAGVLLS
ncbi:hypothetical protein ABFS83_08G108500 [Erythranthe nasuta]